MHIPQKYKFIVQLGKALHTYGVPSYKSQVYLNEIAEKKGIKGSFMDTPTWINYVFYEEDDHTYNYVECVPPGELNLGALSKIVEITNNVLSNKISFAEAKQAIENIKTAPLGYGKLTELFAFMTSAGAFSIILDTSWVSSLLAFLLGAVVYGITLLAQKSSYVRSTLESLVAFTVTIITGLLALKFEQINISMTILASIIVFIPGLSITTALEEITSRSLVSGTAKLFDALVSLFKQFFGVVLGLAVLSSFVDLKPNDVVNDVPNWIDYFAIILLALSLLPVFKVRPKDLLFCVIAGFSSYYTTTLFDFTGILISIFIGTLVAVSCSKLFSKITKSPELVYLVPGIVMLVPGSKAFIGLSSVFLNAGNTYSNMGEQILYIFMGIIGGLIFSGSFIDRKNSPVSNMK
ncbi:threonine/serine ThrE exporter family protein [Marinifilum flexuosum]|uniref:threonine/serine ThrE exporter family protein n=1 Tax=Marinifilum flexuosum TaxID=1117708 RepID=UPI0024955198|nr:threonine/serine exporter family protein [Marinifilum flexuosum]